MPRPKIKVSRVSSFLRTNGTWCTTLFWKKKSAHIQTLNDSSLPHPCMQCDNPQTLVTPTLKVYQCWTTQLLDNAIVGREVADDCENTANYDYGTEWERNGRLVSPIGNVC